ncbi:MAG: lysylphosphatidylglycerol synthase transmembrane domain-containing protein [Candidatus Acidiferrales bacterium]
MRGWLRKALVILLGIVVLAALAYRSRRAFHIGNFNWSKLGHAVAHANLWLLLVSVLGIYACYAIRAFRWQCFCRHFGDSSFWGVYSATLIGFASIFLLGRAGEPVRPLLIARKTRFSVSSQFGIYVLERLFDFATSAVMAGVVLAILTRQLATGGANEAWIHKARASGGILLAGLLVLVALLAYYRLHGAGALDRRLGGWRRAGGWRARVATQFTGFSEGLQAIRSMRDLAVASLVSLVHWMLVAAVYLWVVRSLGEAFAGLNYPSAVLLLAVTMLGSLLQLPGVGGGAQVASFIALTQIFGVDAEPAAAAAIVLWLVTFAASAIVGVPLLIREGWSMGDLRRLAKAEEVAEEHGEHVGVGAASGSDGSGAR